MNISINSEYFNSFLLYNVRLFIEGCIKIMELLAARFTSK